MVDAEAWIHFSGFGIGYEVTLTHAAGQDVKRIDVDTIQEARNRALEHIFRALIQNEDQSCLKK